ncbi:hypothetical protein VSR01_03330 [Actinacidiphila sp. DG2A-62]|uniref:hypothetical protein n=1 Tax=Actinacidiphila sp. DG2A-62 TaxID=3108821 RepID=UPI002DBA8B22|nr:hypothetical protein [Actinacidiphila sp. DG2A-62]MEC3992628.1 hypothetical protein [Actinacidiphila sp. DG2A-62]
MAQRPHVWPGRRGDGVRVVVLVGPGGSLTPTDLVLACKGLAEPRFLLDARDPASEPLYEVCRALGPAERVDFADPAACLAAVREAGADAVTTFTEQLCALAAVLDREACGYDGNRVAWGRKDLQRHALRRAGVSGVRSAPLPDAGALRAFAAEVGFPFVVKPVDGFASRDTWQLKGPADVDAFMAAADADRRARRDPGRDPGPDTRTGPGGVGGAGGGAGGRAGGGSAGGDGGADGWPHGLYAEEFIAGHPAGTSFVPSWVADYGSADVLLGGVRPDEHSGPGAPAGHDAPTSDVADAPALVSSRPPLAWPFRETGLILPSPLPEDEQRAYAAVARRALAAVGATKGAFHVELKSTAAGPEIIEINGRIGGFVARGLRLASGADLGRQAVACALGHPPVLEPRWRRCVALVLHQPPPAARRVTAVPAREALAALPGVIAVDMLAAPGDQVHWRHGTLGMTARLWVVGDDHAQLRERFVGVTEFLVHRIGYADEAGRPVRDRTWLDALSGAGAGSGAAPGSAPRPVPVPGARPPGSAPAAPARPVADDQTTVREAER